MGILERAREGAIANCMYKHCPGFWRGAIGEQSELRFELPVTTGETVCSGDQIEFMTS